MILQFLHEGDNSLHVFAIIQSAWKKKLHVKDIKFELKKEEILIKIKYCNW